ncbi:MAG: hypothetical protein WBG66_20450 [Geitlerinemataceae cyanobacterium]
MGDPSLRKPNPLYSIRFLSAIGSLGCASFAGGILQAGDRRTQYGWELSWDLVNLI